MIICSCTGISDHDVKAAVAWMRAADPAVLITPGKVYRALGRAAGCGGCMPLFLATLRTAPGHDVPIALRGLRAARQEGTGNEGRPEGHRVSQPRAAE
jgi:bacterioferritin-associated ferredoxin